MILSGKRNSVSISSGVRLNEEPYLVLNIFFAGLVVLIIAYSAIFSPVQNNYPVVCLHEIITGEPCFSCGLSHSFSHIVRGNVNEAYDYNVYGMRVFLFFISQLFLRIAFSVYYLKSPDNRKQLIIFDSVGSGVIFLITFWPFIENIIKRFIGQI